MVMDLFLIAYSAEMVALFTVLSVGIPVLIFFHLVKKAVVNAQQIKTLQKELDELKNERNL